MTQSKRTLVGELVYIQPRGKRGIYQADFHFAGKHCKRSLKTTNSKVARRRAMQLEREILEGGSPPRTTPKKEVRANLVKAAEDFISFKEMEGKRAKTITKYRGILNILKSYTERQGILDLSELDLRLIDAYRRERATTIAAKTMSTEATILKSFFAWCAERKLIAENPMAKQRFARPKPRTRSVLSLAQVDQILANVAEANLPVLAMLAFTGMRSGECRNLRVGDVDFDGNWIHVRSRPDAPTKTGLDRKLPMHARLRKVLENLPTKRSGWFFNAPPSRRYPDGLHHLNTKLLNENFLALLKRLRISAGLKNDGFTIHSMRHFFKTFCIASGVPKPIVDDWQGHSIGANPSEHYFHLTDDDSQAWMKRVPFGEGVTADKKVTEKENDRV